MKQLDRLRVGLFLSGLLGPAVGQVGKYWHQLSLPADPRFIVYYGSQDHPALYGYEVVVLDSDIDAAIVRRLGRDALLLGYLSLGEVHMGRAWAAELDRQGLLLEPNPQWRDARFVDLRELRWTELILDVLVPKILARGFRGLFLDTLDDAAFLESLDPGRFRGMTEAAVQLVRALRKRFARVPLMVNRGYDVLPRIVDEIDMVLGESVHSTYDAAADAYVRVAPDAVRWQTDRLNEAKRLRPELKLFSLDYWSPTDQEGIARIYAEARANGFVPYVATIDLTQIVPRS